MSRKQSFYTLNVECICDLCLPFFAIYTGPPPEYVSSQVSSAHRVTDTDIVSATRINSVNNNPSTHAGSSRQQPIFQGGGVTVAYLQFHKEKKGYCLMSVSLEAEMSGFGGVDFGAEMGSEVCAFGD
ncbi:hypothetical protein Tco_0038709 [Tanacetum coccineum]